MESATVDALPTAEETLAELISNMHLSLLVAKVVGREATQRMVARPSKTLQLPRDTLDWYTPPAAPLSALPSLTVPTHPCHFYAILPL